MLPPLPRPHVHVCASGGLSACAGSLPRGLVFGPAHPARLVCVLCSVCSQPLPRAWDLLRARVLRVPVPPPLSYFGLICSVSARERRRRSGLKRRIDLARACMHAIAPALHAHTFHTPWTPNTCIQSLNTCMVPVLHAFTHVFTHVCASGGLSACAGMLPPSPRPPVHVCASGGLSACAGRFTPPWPKSSDSGIGGVRPPKTIPPPHKL